MSQDSSAQTIAWALRPFGAIKVDRLYEGDTFVHSATLPGAVDETGKELVGLGSTIREATVSLWKQLTERHGNHILMSGRRYEWHQGIFQEVIQ